MGNHLKVTTNLALSSSRNTRKSVNKLILVLFLKKDVLLQHPTALKRFVKFLNVRQTRIVMEMEDTVSMDSAKALALWIPNARIQILIVLKENASNIVIQFRGVQLKPLFASETIVEWNSALLVLIVKIHAVKSVI